MHLILLSILSKYDTILVVWWGTGWHIQPIVNISWELKDKKLLWLGWTNSEEEKVAGENSIPFKSISTLKLATTKSPKLLLYPFVLIQGILQARKILRSVIVKHETIHVPNFQKPGSLSSFAVLRRKDRTSRWQKSNTPICVFSKGWPGSVAIGIAAWMLGIPLYIHESDTIPGRSSRILGRFADTIFLGFESAKQYFQSEKCEVIGQILSASFAKEVPEGRRIFRENQEKISHTPLHKEGINWKTNRTHILVICWSQWSQAIFEAIMEQFSSSDKYEWIIALGKLNEWMKQDFEKMKNIQAFEWISQEDMASLLTNTDLAITRGSATTLAEIDIFWIKKIIIPLPHSAWDHQYWNAKEYEKNGDILLEQKNLNQLTEILKELCQKITNR